ncbi:MAG TPA: RNA-binding transcriptional accessory protein [Actinobacteria bacterium]|nr:RNA-binding transcriptional accessory protein [Actinomycetota bacterium]
MDFKFSSQLSASLKINESGIISTLKLLDEGNTIPFISRYRKEATGNLDELQILNIKKAYENLLEIDSRRKSILKELEKQGNLSEELKKSINEADALNTLEDLYLPFRPKRKTRASVAKEMGLEPLAELIFSQKDFDLENEAEKYLNENVIKTSDALEGAGFIIAEWINEDKNVREEVRRIFNEEAVVQAGVLRGMEEAGIKYKDYFEFNEPLRKILSHRFLAIKRGEKEKFLKVSILPPEDIVFKKMENLLIKNNNKASEMIKNVIKDCYKRLLGPSLETEITVSAKDRADDEAIKVFADNLRQLLLAPFLGRKKVLAIDPGYRTGCKVVCLNEQGDLLYNDNIYPHEPQNRKEEAESKIKLMVEKFKISVIAIGNGTAGRETKEFISSIFLKNKSIKIFVVSESGASIYSASDAAREEFPDYDVTVRGAVSIGRRLMDPLAELVKIDPKSIGVGQYQHDVDQSKLKENLDFVVESCVNLVGVNLNTASKHLLMYVSGLGPKIAQNITDYRKQNGAFRSRDELKNVPKLGEKVFEQCAGFLRIEDGINPLDGSAVHPESYYVVEKIASDLGIKVSDMIGNEKIKEKIKLQDYIDEKVGLPTLHDILGELAKPGRDPRENVDEFEFNAGISNINDLKTGMILNGIVNNITNFGAFVDMGIKDYGLIHISEMSDRFIKSPHEILKLNQKVAVRVIDIDKQRKRISLSLKNKV